MKKYKLISEFLGMGLLSFCAGFFFIFGVYRFFQNVDIFIQYLVSTIAGVFFLFSNSYELYHKKLSKNSKNN